MIAISSLSRPRADTAIARWRSRVAVLSPVRKDGATPHVPTVQLGVAHLSNRFLILIVLASLTVLGALRSISR
jgi:hypothetical protein